MTLIQKSWCCNSEYKALKIDEYENFSYFRKNRKGGVIKYVKKEIEYQHIE